MRVLENAVQVGEGGQRARMHSLGAMCASPKRWILTSSPCLASLGEAHMAESLSPRLGKASCEGYISSQYSTTNCNLCRLPRFNHLPHSLASLCCWKMLGRSWTLRWSRSWQSRWGARAAGHRKTTTR